MQFLNLFPTKIGFLIGITNGLCGAGSFFPLAWKALVDKKLISYSEIMWTWFGFSALSLVLGTLVYPWHNLPQDLTQGRLESFKIKLEKIFGSKSTEQKPTKPTKTHMTLPLTSSEN